MGSRKGNDNEKEKGLTAINCVYQFCPDYTDENYERHQEAEAKAIEADTQYKEYLTKLYNSKEFQEAFREDRRIKDLQLKTTLKRLEEKKHADSTGSR